MKSSKKTYEEVAEYCSSYSPDSNCKCKTTNSADDHCRSCTNCRHFDKAGEYCKLDLYDKIVKDHGIAK